MGYRRLSCYEKELFCQKDMKHLSFITILGLVGISFAEEASKSEPPELSRLRHNFEQAKSDAIQPITAKYCSLLEDLKKKYTKAGNLDSALAVEAELNLIRAQEGDVKKVGMVPSPTTKEELVEYLGGTKWEYFNQENKKIGITQFNKDGTYTTPWGEKVPWSATSAKTVVVQHGHWRRVITFSHDYRTYDEITEGEHGSCQAKLLRLNR